MRNLIFAATALSLIAGLPGLSQDRKPPTVEEQSAFRDLTDEQFAEKAAQFNLTEVALGTHAAEKATRAEIQQFGKQLKEDHTKANHQLQMIMMKRGLSFPSKPDAKHQAKVDKLVATQGEEFDRAYVKEMVEGHKIATLLYQHESENGKVAEMKSFAAQTLPTVRKHLQKSEQLWKDHFASVR